MKKLFFVIAAVLLSHMGFAQDGQIESLAGKGKTKIRVGGFGAPAIKFTTFDDQLGVLLGGYAGVMLNSRIMLGAGAYALVNNIEAPRTDVSDPTLYWNMWYTGFVPEYTIKSNKLFHMAVGALIGGGGVMKNERYKGLDETENFDVSGFFVGEPHVNFEMNITSYLRLAVGGSYRFVSGSNTAGITDEKLSGPAAHFTIKAGRF
ncbi:hypothetical protein ACFOTA_04610 [Chitinophaga sp. GCM10012297]|uniref:Outer membrane protein beta-barrel domain-containing protein n=1 Tax=Chitinophaga chungangae TaxID=2821488 RepID=A0ABS3Y9W9_9BACT|nr:hypothetical protein [Chitinophaga chungangae]MBO9151477.1 hypothetical protein [Chitinophaga chungangae]